MPAVSSDPASSAATWPPGLIALIPVYNHQSTVGTVVSELRELGAPVLVVDDGSTDGSGQAAADAGAELITHDHNQGKAAALQTGLNAADEQGYRHVLTIDADGQHPIAMAQKLVEAARHEHHAVIIGVRDMSPAPLRSRAGRACSNFGAAIVGGQRFGDTQSGLRVYPLPVTTRLAVAANRYAYEIEVLVRAAWAGTEVIRVPVSVNYPEQRISHFRTWSDTTHGVLALLRLAATRCMPGWRTRQISYSTT